MHAKMRDARGPSKATFPLPIAFLPTSNTFFSPTRPGRPAARRGPAVLFKPAERVSRRAPKGKLARNLPNQGDS